MLPCTRFCRPIKFAKWPAGLRDPRTKARVLVRLDNVRLGNPGDVRSAGGGVSELRIDVGPGYRLYFTRRQRIVIVLLRGGDKSTQTKDIARAKLLAHEIG
jgi:putative addiction module killer protein